MAVVVQENNYSINLLNYHNVKSNNAVVTSGTATFENKTDNTISGQALKVNVGNHTTERLIFNFADRFEHLILENGVYNLSFAIKTSKDTDFVINTIINGIETANEFSVLENNGKYTFLALALILSVEDVLNLTFEVPTGDVTSFNFYIDAFKLELVNHTNYLPTLFSKVEDSKMGNYDYNNTASSQSFTGTEIELFNNSLGSLTDVSNGLKSIPEPYNNVTNAFDWSKLDIGDRVDIRLDVTITTTTANQIVELYMKNAIGGANPYNISWLEKGYKNSGLQNSIQISNFFYLKDDNTRLNPSKFAFMSDDNATILVTGWLVSITKR